MLFGIKITHNTYKILQNKGVLRMRAIGISAHSTDAEALVSAYSFRFICDTPLTYAILYVTIHIRRRYDEIRNHIITQKRGFCNPLFCFLCSFALDHSVLLLIESGRGLCDCAHTDSTASRRCDHTSARHLRFTRARMTA